MSVAGERPLHVRLLEGLDIRSRADGSVHNIKTPDGKTVAEVCVGKNVTLLNFFSELSVPIPDGLIFSGRDRRFPGRGLRITPENLLPARELLHRVVGSEEPSSSDSVAELFADPDDAIREHLESVFGTPAFRVVGDAIELDLSVVGETGLQRFIPPAAWVARESVDGLDAHAVGRGERTALCGVRLEELTPETADSSLEIVSCPRCRVRLMAAEIAALPGSGPPGEEDDPDQPYLHDEIARILRDEENRWMTTEEIATAVNVARRFRKRDGTDVTAFQIHGRTRNYARLFERDGSRVRLRAANPVGPPGFIELIEHMDALAEVLGLVVESVRTGKNYRLAILETGSEFTSGVGVYNTSRGVEFNLQVFRDLGEDDVANDLVARIRRVSGRNPGGKELWVAVPCDTLIRDWARTRTEVMEPYFHARLSHSAAPGSPGSSMGESWNSGDAPTTRIGYRNRNGQVVIEATGLSGNDNLQKIYKLRCGNCGAQYGANGSDIFQRKCPECQSGTSGLSYE